MTISGVIAIQKERELINNLKSIVKEILKENKEGLNRNQILDDLRERKKYYKGVEEHLRALLWSECFEIYEGGENKIYKIKDS